MPRLAIPAVLSSPWVKTLLDHHRAHHGTAVVVGHREEGYAIRRGTRRIATLRAEGDVRACEALALALGAVTAVEAEGRQSKGELGRRVRQLSDRLRRAEGELAGPVRRQHDELTRQSRKLATAAATDPLTSALNRRAIEVRLREAAVLSAQEAAPLAVIMCDIDHFKNVNDTHGHLVGDAVIAAVGKALRAGRRRGDAVGRWGGEEFLVLLPGCPVEPALTIAEDMCESIRAMTFSSDVGPFSVTASFGVVASRIQDSEDEGAEVMALVAAADDLLYAAKADGRDRVRGPQGEEQASA